MVPVMVAGAPDSWQLCRGRGCAGVVGGEAQRPCRETGMRGVAVRVLRAGLDGGLAGSGDVAGAAVAAGGDAGRGARGDRGGVLRCGGVPGAAVGAAAAGRGAGGAARRSGPGVGRGGDRGVRAGVLRQPVRVDGSVVRALRCLAVDAGGGRAGGLARRGPRADHALTRAVVEAGDHPDPGPGADGDGGADAGAGPVPGRASAVRVPAR
jgi:hypothetical protein